MYQWLKMLFVGAAKRGLQVPVTVLLGGFAWTQTPPSTDAFPPVVQASRPTQERQVDPTPAGRLPGGVLQREDAYLLPNLQIFDPGNLHLVGSRASGDLRLKFATTIWNAGAGPLETRGAKNPETETLEVYQFFRTTAGRMMRGPRIGTFNYSHRHGHLHLEAFARYELWSLDDTGRPLELVALNRKVGFCLMDINPVNVGLRNAARAPVYSGCRADIQGISVGYADEYVAQLFEQDLNVSGLPDGTYALVTTANPDTALVETNYADNVASIQLRLKGDTVDIVSLAAAKDRTKAQKLMGSVSVFGATGSAHKGQRMVITGYVGRNHTRKAKRSVWPIAHPFPGHGA